MPSSISYGTKWRYTQGLDSGPYRLGKVKSGILTEQANTAFLHAGGVGCNTLATCMQLLFNLWWWSPPCCAQTSCRLLINESPSTKSATRVVHPPRALTPRYYQTSALTTPACAWKTRCQVQTSVMQAKNFVQTPTKTRTERWASPALESTDAQIGMYVECEWGPGLEERRNFKRMDLGKEEDGPVDSVHGESENQALMCEHVIGHTPHPAQSFCG